MASIRAMPRDAFVGNDGRVGAFALQMAGPDVRSGGGIHQLKVYFQRGVVALNVTDDCILHAEIRLQTAYVGLRSPKRSDVCSEITRRPPNRVR